MKVLRIFGWILGAIPLVLGATLTVAWFNSSNACEDPGLQPAQLPMRAILYCDYGTAEVLRLEQVEKPVPAEGQMLVKVQAAAANPLDWHYMRGTPYVMRLDTGLRKPKDLRMGVDFAGTVEAIGSGVTRYKPGDAVFGGRNGAFGEYLLVREQGAVAPMPANISFEQAAGVHIAGITALQALRKAGVGPGTKLLINGASGGVGTFAVQIAKSLGADVTGVCSTRNLELVRSLGADRVIDYTQQDYTDGALEYDAIIDNVGNHSVLANRRALQDKGRYVLIGGGGPDDGAWIGPLINPIKALLVAPFISQDMGMMMAQSNAADLAVLGDMMQAGSVRPVVDRTFPLRETAEAIRYLETGRARGKVVILMQEPANEPGTTTEQQGEDT